MNPSKYLNHLGLVSCCQVLFLIPACPNYIAPTTSLPSKARHKRVSDYSTTALSVDQISKDKEFYKVKAKDREDTKTKSISISWNQAEASFSFLIK